MSKIILFRGKSGTGKSILSNELAKKLKLVVLHKEIYDVSASVVQEHSSRNKLCFDFLFRLLQTVIDSDASIILDFGFNDNNGSPGQRKKPGIMTRLEALDLLTCRCKS